MTCECEKILLNAKPVKADIQGMKAHPVFKLISFLLLLCCFVPAVYAVQAPERIPSRVEPDDGMWMKFGRGMTDILFFYLEIPYQIDRIASEELDPIAFFAGTGKGIFTGIKRLFVGVYEVVTFPVPWPNGYKPLLKPEFLIPEPYVE